MPLLSLTTLAEAATQYLMVLDAGGVLSAAQLAQALDAANDMLDNWSSEELMVPGLLLQTFALTANVGSYTIGPALTWSVAHPMAIEAAAHINTMNAVPYTTPIKVVNGLQWASIENRSSSNNLIEFLFYDRQTTGKVYVSPSPLGGSIELTMWTALTQFANTTTQITVPNGYPLAMKLALAIVLAPYYDMAPTPALLKNAADAMARIRGLNAALLGQKPPAGQTDAATAPPTMIQTG